MQTNQMYKMTIKMGMEETKKANNRKIGYKKEKDKITDGTKKGTETAKSIPRRTDLMNNKTRKK